MNRRRTRRVAVLMAGITALLLLFGIRHVTHRREVVRLGYQLSAATAELRRMQEDNRRLRLEKSVLTNPDRIERLAEGLGLVKPEPDQIRIIRSDVVVAAGQQGEERP